MDEAVNLTWQLAQFWACKQDLETKTGNDKIMIHIKTWILNKSQTNYYISVENIILFSMKAAVIIAEELTLSANLIARRTKRLTYVLLNYNTLKILIIYRKIIENPTGKKHVFYY